MPLLLLLALLFSLALLAPEQSLAASFVLSGDYRCEMRGDIRQGSGIIEAAAVLSLTIGLGNAFASGKVSGKKTTMSNPPAIATPSTTDSTNMLIGKCMTAPTIM